jgi:hypothetical protein
MRVNGVLNDITFLCPLFDVNILDELISILKNAVFTLELLKLLIKLFEPDGKGFSSS